MTNRFILFLTILCALTSFAFNAWAQDCTYQRDLIFEMRDGRIGAYNVWDAVYGDVSHVEAFSSAVNVGEADTIAAGARMLQGKNKEQDEGAFEGKSEGKKQLLLVRFDYRGRTMWEKTHVVRGLDHVIKILPVSETSFIVIANIAGKTGKVWTGIFNDQGDLLRQTTITYPQGKSMTATDAMMRQVRKGFVMVGNAYDAAGEAHSVIYFLNTKGQVVQHRAYLTGPGNKLHGIGPAGEDGYVVTGEIGTDDARFAGWVARLDKDGTIVWQQQYTRGVHSALHAAHPYKTSVFIVAGYSEPHQTGAVPLNRAGWVMALDANSGEIAWQRYYTGMYAYTARDILVSADGLISVMLDGDWLAPDFEKNPAAYNPATDLGERKDIDHVSILTIDPRGTLLYNDPHYFAQGSHAQQMFLTKKEQRALVGATRTLYQIEQISDVQGEAGSDPVTPPVKSQLSWDALLLVTPQAEPYADPCAR